MERDDLHVSSEMLLEVVRYSELLVVVSVAVLNSLPSESLSVQNVMDTSPVGRLGYQSRIFLQRPKVCQSASPLTMSDGLT